MNTDITGKHNVIVDLKPHRGLLLASPRINCPQIEIQAIEDRVALGWFAFFDDFAVKLLDEQHGGSPSQNVAC